MVKRLSEKLGLKFALRNDSFHITGSHLRMPPTVSQDHAQSGVALLSAEGGEARFCSKVGELRVQRRGPLVA